MPVTRTEIRPGAYYDSIVLMQLQRALAGLPGVVDAGVVMATPANCSLLGEGGLYPEEAEAAKSDDLLIVVRAETDQAAGDAIGRVDELLAARRSASPTSGYRPHTIAGGLDALPEARWLLVSVPGRFAAGVSRQGLEQGLNVFLYSDNVPIEDELSLKETARGKGLFVMGPDCGTAIVNGVGLGFANRVRKGPVGLVGASGTGLQAVTSAVHKLGSGVSHAIGTGGRDLKAEIGGITALQGLHALAADPETDVIVLISKPPDPQVAAALLGVAQTCGKPVIVHFTGYPAPAYRLGNLHFALNLQDAARLAVEQTGGQPVMASAASGSDRFLRGLFSGGTLAVEAVLALQNFLYPLYTNVPVSDHQRLENPLQSRAHTIVDLGEDVFTQGRLHPMMDNDLRLRRMRQEAEDPETGLIWLDVVLGEGAHPDPAAELAPVIAEIREATGIEFAVLIIGTEDDPQGIDRQAEAFREAGAEVFTVLQDAVEDLLVRFGGAAGSPVHPPAGGDLGAPFAALNAGLESFYDSLLGQGAQAVQLDWKPPAGGNEKLAGILANLNKLHN
ncbi:MAG TPA: acyl-CoA synthetase FdrA [Anaerolineales bacterium]|nr:acyl-CoA synthetase FdrA [Anaerolineales bacterium]